MAGNLKTDLVGYGSGCDLVDPHVVAAAKAAVTYESDGARPEQEFDCQPLPAQTVVHQIAKRSGGFAAAAQLCQRKVNAVVDAQLFTCRALTGGLVQIERLGIVSFLIGVTGLAHQSSCKQAVQVFRPDRITHVASFAGSNVGLNARIFGPDRTVTECSGGRRVHVLHSGSCDRLGDDSPGLKISNDEAKPVRLPRSIGLQ